MALFKFTLALLAIFLLVLVIRFVLGLIRFNRRFSSEADDARLQTYLTENTPGRHTQPNTPPPSGTTDEESSGAP